MGRSRDRGAPSAPPKRSECRQKGSSGPGLLGTAFPPAHPNDLSPVNGLALGASSSLLGLLGGGRATWSRSSSPSAFAGRLGVLHRSLALLHFGSAWLHHRNPTPYVGNGAHENGVANAVPSRETSAHDGRGPRGSVVTDDASSGGQQRLDDLTGGQVVERHAPGAIPVTDLAARFEPSVERMDSAVLFWSTAL